MNNEIIANGNLNGSPPLPLAGWAEHDVEPLSSSYTNLAWKHSEHNVVVFMEFKALPNYPEAWAAVKTSSVLNFYLGDITQDSQGPLLDRSRGDIQAWLESTAVEPGKTVEDLNSKILSEEILEAVEQMENYVKTVWIKAL